MQADPVFELKTWRQAVTWQIWKAINWFTSPAGRVVLLLPFIGAAFVLLYNYSWRPITAPLALPPGVTEQDPVISEQLVAELIEQRIKRQNNSFPAFRVDNLFISSSTETTVQP